MPASRDAIVGFTLLALFAIGGWWLITAAFSSLAGMEASLAAPLIAAVVTVFTLLFSFFRDRNKARKEVHREKKIEVYSIFFNIIFRLLKDVKNKTPGAFIESPEFQDTMFDLMRGVVFYGSPKVLKAISDWRTSSSASPDPLSAIKSIGDVLLAMRDDIGLSNSGVTNLSIHQVYMVDDVNKIRDMKATT